MTDDALLRRLDRIQATLQLAFRPQLEQVRNAVRSDAVNASILDIADDWVGSSALQRAVANKTGKSTRTVRDRLPELAEQGVLEVQGSEKRLEYRRTGLV
jgi:hypothetical protein